MADVDNSFVGLTSLKAERADGVVTITFSRPTVMNAVDETMLDELGAVVREIDVGQRVRAAIEGLTAYLEKRPPAFLGK
jgi:1,4-dihydroxy-2-naphthoyl-CoA synthase